MTELYENIRETISRWWESLSGREKRLVSLLTCAVAVFIVMLFLGYFIKSVANKKDRLTKVEQALSDIKILEGPFRISKMKEEAEWRKISRNDVELFSLLQLITARLSLQIKDLQERKQVLPNSKVTEISVNVNLSKLSLDKLTALIEAIETSSEGGLVKVTKMKINTRFDEPDLLDVQLTVSTWKVS